LKQKQDTLVRELDRIDAVTANPAFGVAEALVPIGCRLGLNDLNASGLRGTCTVTAYRRQ
jgi:hypothetical protein